MGAPVIKATTSVVIVLALVGGWGSAGSERTDSLGQQQAASCDTPEHRQFDFWIGQWDVFLANGQRAGSNAIEKKLGNCVLHERWTGTSGSIGESFNVYRKDTQQWHQSWVDNTGLLLRLDGGLVGDDMVLQGPGTAGDGTPIVNRITWSVVAGDPSHVRQFWETSRDGGTTWQVASDGHYRREN